MALSGQMCIRDRCNDLSGNVAGGGKAVGLFDIGAGDDRAVLQLSLIHILISERAVRGVLKTLPVYHKTVSARTEKHHIAPNGAKNPGYPGVGIACLLYTSRCV